jgi:hypothetical protein
LLEIDHANATEAYERVLPEAMELARERDRVVNLEIGKVVERAMAAAKRLPPFEVELRALPGFHVERLDAFAEHTLALYAAEAASAAGILRADLPALTSRAPRESCSSEGWMRIEGKEAWAYPAHQTR